jgi:RNA polymerase sigma-70 factor (ECF subfamily)
MMIHMTAPFTEDPDTARLLDQAARGDVAATGELLERHRDRLTRMVRLRLDARVRARLGISDVIQEAWLEASQRIDDYFRNPEVPFYVWLRFITAQRVLTAHRRHIGAQGRAVGREQQLDVAGLSATSVSLAAELIGRDASPSRAANRAELRERVTEALEAMEPIDREVLALRHFEQLGNVDVARVLGIDTDAASKRYVRALRRLRVALGDVDLGQDSIERGSGKGGRGQRDVRA